MNITNEHSNNYNENKNMIKINTICIQLFCFASVASFFPPLRALTGELIPSVICCSLSILSILLSMRMNRFQISLSAFLATAAFAYIAITCVLCKNTVIFNRYFSLVMFLGGYPIFRTVLAETKEKTRIIMLRTITLLALVTCINTAYALVQDPYLSRSIKSEGQYSQSVLMRGIGGYEVAYFAVLLAVIAFQNSFSGKKANRIISIICFSVFSVLVILSNYMTALIVLVIGCVLVTGYQAANGPSGNGMTILAIIIMIGTVSIINIEEVLTFISSLGGDGRVSRVLLGSGNIIEGIIDEFIADRAPVMMKSIEAFMDSPIIGQVGMTSILGARGVIAQAGQHSFILDTFAYFGFFGGLLIVGALLLELYELKQTYSSVTVIPVSVALLILVLFNNATVSMASAVFILLPLIQELNAEKDAE